MVEECKECGKIYTVTDKKHECIERRPIDVKPKETDIAKESHKLIATIKVDPDKVVKQLLEAKDFPHESFDEIHEEIEFLQADKIELLLKNAELAGFAAGLKWAVEKLA